MANCRACGEELVFQPDEIDGETEQESVPDDLELRCGCHFHWQCLLDESPTVALTLKCPSCEAYLPVNASGPSTTNQFIHAASGAKILAQYTNEGGVQPDLDLFPSITEEAYVLNHPETRPARAFHVMCSEGDVDGIVELLVSVSEDPTIQQSIICYQDPLSSSRSGLHLAVENGQDEVVLLLLWLCSSVSRASFPESARHKAESTGLGRLSVSHEGDIRFLVNAEGMTAGRIAAQMAGRWTEFIGTGLLA